MPRTAPLLQFHPAACFLNAGYRLVAFFRESDRLILVEPVNHFVGKDDVDDWLIEPSCTSDGRSVSAGISRRRIRV